MNLEDTYVNYALVMRLPFGQIQDLKRFCIENDFNLIYDKASLRRLIIKESIPSGNLEGVEYEE